MERGPSLLDEYFVRTAGVRSPKVCFISTAAGDPEEMLAKYYKTFSKLGCRPSHLAFFRKPRRGSIPLKQIESGLLAQDAIYVGGGNTRSMLAVWREWGLDLHLRAAWERGIVLGGASAGSICWFEQGVTDSIAGPLTAMPCLGFLSGSNCPHYDSEPKRRPTFRRLVAGGGIAEGVAADDGVALHYIDGKLAHVVSSRPRAKGYRVTRSGKRAIERRLKTRYLGRA